MSQAIKVSEGKLPEELAAALEPGLRQALDSPARREILRVLNDSDRPLDVREIASRLTDFTVSEIGYHVRVLRRSGGVTAEDGSPPARPGYVSGVAENSRALAALRAMQQWDREQRGVRAARSSAVRTIFRIPRPTRSIRLGDRNWKAP